MMALALAVSFFMRLPMQDYQKKAVKPEEPVSARHGAQVVYDDEGKIAGFFPGYANDQI